MIDKRYRRVADALARCPDLRDGAVVLVAGFGDAGVVADDGEIAQTEFADGFQ